MKEYNYLVVHTIHRNHNATVVDILLERPAPIPWDAR